MYQGKSKKNQTTKMSYAVLVDSVLFVNQVFDEHIDAVKDETNVVLQAAPAHKEMLVRIM